jgi:serine/threonine-protein kinase
MATDQASPIRIGKYEVVSHLATGGMAQIYLARQSGLGAFERHVVLKTILRERANDQRFVTMFLDEAKLAATLNHQNVAQVYEVDQADGAYFMAMEFVHGENVRAILETTIRRGWTVPLELAILIVSGAAAGLHHAHERRGRGGAPLNIVHRDVSPANVMVGFDGSVKVLDFGIAKAEERATKTIGGTIKGKYGYMSPEQCKGKPIDRRGDIFALGIILYELTTLRRAFKGNDDFETMKRIVSGDIVAPSVAVPGYPPELEAIVRTAMATDAGARFQTAAELIEALDAFTVRARLTCSNTAMARFMTQLFGEKREPWVEGARDGAVGEHTEISHSEDDEQTSIVEPKVSKETLRDQPLRDPTASAAAAAELGQDATNAGRPSARRLAVGAPGERPSLPFPPAGGADGAGGAGPADDLAVPVEAAAVAAPRAESAGEGRRARMAGHKETLKQPTIAAPRRPSEPVQIVAAPPAAEVIATVVPRLGGDTGAQSLITDDKLGWETPSNMAAQPLGPDASGTALGDADDDVSLRPSWQRWWVVAGVVAVIVAGAVVLLTLT